jgi:AmiR/NasT family two-component response regulator
MTSLEKSAQLSDYRVLVVEDEPLEALDYCDRLTEAGASIVGPYMSVTDALEAVLTESLDVALIDYALADRNSQELQVALEERDIPFVVLTGYPRVLVRRTEQQLVLSKPVSADLLRMTVRAAAATAAR